MLFVFLPNATNSSKSFNLDLFKLRMSSVFQDPSTGLPPERDFPRDFPSFSFVTACQPACCLARSSRVWRHWRDTSSSNSSLDKISIAGRQCLWLDRAQAKSQSEEWEGKCKSDFWDCLLKVTEKQ